MRALTSSVQISGPVEQMRELVVGARAPAGCRAAPFRQSLLDCFESDVVASFPAHDFVEQCAVEREQRGRCSARGVSSPYSQSITKPNCRLAANGDGASVCTV